MGQSTLYQIRGSYDSNDGTFINFNPQSKTITFRNGKTIQYEGFPSQGASPTLFRPTKAEDTNGNYISITYVSQKDQAVASITDTLGRVINFTYTNGQIQDIRQNVATSTVDPAGVHVYATFHWVALYGNNYAWYSFTGLAANAVPPLTQALNVIDKCTYANSTGYQFTYGDWAIINKITHFSSSAATRNYVAYNYPLVSAGALSDAPTYTKQTISADGVNGSDWIYTSTKSGTGVVTSTAITDPNGTVTTTNLDANGLTSSVVVKDSANKIWRTTSFTWTTSGTSPVAATIQVNDDAANQSSRQFTYDSVGNITDLKENDFGLVTVRETAASYVDSSFAQGAYTAKHILNLPKQILVKDGGGAIKARTDFAYDSTAFLNTSDITTTNHDNTAFGVGSTTRGNVTSTTRYADAAGPSGGVTRTITYDSLGNVRIQQEDCCVQKKTTFSSATQYAYPDSVASGPDTGPQFTVNYTFNLDKGLRLTETDENSQVRTLAYDSMNRLSKVTSPVNSVNATQAQATTSFDDSTASPTVTNSTTANSLVTVNTFDGLGRETQQNVKNMSTLVTTVNRSYNGLGQLISLSNAFGPGETQVNTTFTYDALGRAKTVTPPSGGFKQYNYAGNAATVTDEAAKQKTTYQDAFGRLVRVDEPGWGDALPGSGSATVTGVECCGMQNPDTGTVSMSVNGLTKTISYGFGITAAQLATALRDAFNNDSSSPVNASASGATVFFNSKTTGSVTNYSLSGSSVSFIPGTYNPPSFGVSTSGPTMTGGDDAVAPANAVLNALRHLTTTYGYDVLNNQVSVSQAAVGPVSGQQIAGQSRSYSYDGLSRLTSSTTPESGTVNTFYTNSSGGACAADPNVACRIQDPRGVVKTFAYDAINRLIGVSYSDSTLSQAYQYDFGGSAAFAQGRLTKVTDGANSQTFTYDNWGQIITATEKVDQSSYLVQYGYNTASQLSSITYPTNRVVTQSYDAIGRMSGVSNGATNYLSAFTYNGAFQPLTFKFGNNVQASFGYNDHLQISRLAYSNATRGRPANVLNLTYDYGTGNNGQIQAVHYFPASGVEDPTKSEYFSYDQWARMSAAHTGTVNSTSGTWSMTWAYDRLGNRLQQNLVGGNVTVGQPQFTVDANTNRITNAGISYDSTGNETNDGVNAYAYDGNNRVANVNNGAASYTYLGSLRIKKVVGTATTVYIYSGTKLIVEYVNGSVSKEYIYNGRQLAATLSGTSITYHHPDHLSNRTETDSFGAILRSYGHFPFGETWYETGTPDKWKFTTFEADRSESSLDYSDFRYYESLQGRFVNHDLLGGIPAIPQSLNRYSYVGNDVASAKDSPGLLWGAEALCMLDDMGNFTNNCARLGGGNPDGSGDPIMDIACAPSVFGGGSPCAGGGACPVFELFACSGFGTANIALGGHLGGDMFTGPLLGDLATWGFTENQTQVNCTQSPDYSFNCTYKTLDPIVHDFGGPFNPALSDRGPFVPEAPPAPRVLPTTGSTIQGLVQMPSVSNLGISAAQSGCGKPGDAVANRVATTITSAGIHPSGFVLAMAADTSCKQ